MNKMHWNLIKIRSYAIFSWLNESDKFSSYFKVDKCLGDVFDCLIIKYETFSLVNSWCLRNKLKFACDLYH